MSRFRSRSNVTIGNVPKAMVDTYEKQVGIRFLNSESPTGWSKMFIPKDYSFSMEDVDANPKLTNITMRNSLDITIRTPTDNKGHYKIEHTSPYDAKSMYQKSRELAKAYKKEQSAVNKPEASREIPTFDSVEEVEESDFIL